MFQAELGGALRFVFRELAEIIVKAGGRTPVEGPPRNAGSQTASQPASAMRS